MAHFGYWASAPRVADASWFAIVNSFFRSSPKTARSNAADVYEKELVDRGRQMARQAFGPFLAHLSAAHRAAYRGEIEFAYQPYYSYGEILAPFC